MKTSTEKPTSPGHHAVHGSDDEGKASSPSQHNMLMEQELEKLEAWMMIEEEIEELETWMLMEEEIAELQSWMLKEEEIGELVLTAESIPWSPAFAPISPEYHGDDVSGSPATMSLTGFIRSRENFECPSAAPSPAPCPQSPRKRRKTCHEAASELSIANSSTGCIRSRMLFEGTSPAPSPKKRRRKCGGYCQNAM